MVVLGVLGTAWGAEPDPRGEAEPLGETEPPLGEVADPLGDLVRDPLGV